MSQRSQNLLQIHGAVLLFGFPGLIGKLLALSPVVIVFGRVAVAALALLLASAVCGLPFWPRPRRSLLAFIGLGLLLAASSATFFQAVQVSTVAIALIAFSTFPVFVTLLEPFLFGEKRRVSDVVLTGIALAGIAILMPSLEPGDRATQGVLWGVISGLTFALLSLLNRKYVRQHSGMMLALYQDGFAAIALLPFAMLWWPTLMAMDVILLLILGVLCTAVAHSLFIAGMRGIQARSASMIACMEPVYGSILAALVLHEFPGVRTVLGGLLVLGVALYASWSNRGGNDSV